VAAIIAQVGDAVEAGLGLVADAVTAAIAENPEGESFIIGMVAAGSLRITLEPREVNLAKGGGQGTLTVTTAEGLDWTAVSTAPWLSIVSGATGIGSGTVVYNAQAFDGTGERFGTIEVLGESTFLTQYGSEVNGACCCKADCPCGGYPSAICEEHCPCCVSSCRWSEFPNCDNEGDHDYRCVTTDTAEAMTPDQCLPAQCWNRVAW
jgi:hypothetical protein